MKKLMIGLAALAAANAFAIQGTISTETAQVSGDIKWQPRAKAYLVEKGFTLHEIARVVGISTAATTTFRELYAEYRHKAFYKYRKEEIKVCGHGFWQAEGEKKSSQSFLKSVSGK